MNNLSIPSAFKYVAIINKIYDGLSEKSNEYLRQQIHEFRNELANSNDKEKALNDNLHRVYAIFKEFARRLTLGPIEVDANSNDEILCESFDFIDIKDGKAIYNNQWRVCGELYRWRMVHYDEQLLGGIFLHSGYAIEMATGEGKTLVATLPVFLNAISGEGVHLMTVNEYLSIRDCEIMRPLFMFFGISVDCLEYYERGSVERRKAYECDITYGMTSSFVFDYLYDHIATNPNECVQKMHNFALIDEIDSVLIDDAINPHIISGGDKSNHEKIYREKIDVVKEMLKVSKFSQPLYEVDKLYKKVYFTEAGKEWLRFKEGNTELFLYEDQRAIPGYDLFSEDEKNKWGKMFFLQNVFFQLLRALTLFEKDIDYIIGDSKGYKIIVIIDENTGRQKYGHRWEHGLHTAIEVKEGVKVTDDSNGMAVITPKNYLRLYNKVGGMSGTIMLAENELNEVYDLKCVGLPTHRPLIREDEGLNIYKRLIDKDNAIIASVAENYYKGRPTLLGCFSIKRANEFEKLLNEAHLPFNRLDAKTTQNEAKIVSQAGRGNTITLATSVAGRGTDIILSDDALSKGGLRVIATELFDSSRIDKQLSGRAGRQGNPGSSVIFVCIEDTIIKNLPEEEYEELREASLKEEGDKLPSKEFSRFFLRAQECREKYLREERYKVAKKDDIIAPQRAKFYKERNEVLTNSGKSFEIINDIVLSSNSSFEEIKTNLSKIYNLILVLCERSLLINPRIQKIEVPFSCKMDLFALTFEIERIVCSYRDFMQELYRLLILNIYDKQWKEFVLYILSDLSSSEIDHLDSRYENMMVSIQSQILDRLRNSTIIFDPQTLSDGIQPSLPIVPPKKSMQIAKDDPCPCQSGKKYGDCHGRFKRAIRRR